MMTDRKQINKEACAWIARLHDREPTPQERDELHAWINQSPEHGAEIRQMAKLWNELNVLTELAVAVEAPARESTQPSPVLAYLFNHNVLAGVAGCILLGLIIVFTFPDRPEPSEQLHAAYTTVVGEQRIFTLEDGSTMQLNTNSQVEVNYSADTRDIYMVRGQAHFEVAPNRQRPFRVHVDQAIVRAVGTAFAVYLKDKFVEVTVTEGKIELNTIEQPKNTGRQAPATSINKLAVVNAGQNATFNREIQALESIETIAGPEISQKLAWREGLLRFSGTPLEEAIQEVSRYTSLSIVILDPEIRKLRIGGFFRVGETEKMFEALESSFGLKVDHVNEKLVYLTAAATDSTP